MEICSLEIILKSNPTFQLQIYKHTIRDHDELIT